MALDAQSMYTINRTYEVFLLGNGEFVQKVKKHVGTLNFVVFPETSTLHHPRDMSFFTVSAVDFSRPDSLQQIAADFEKIATPMAYKLVYVTSQQPLTQEQLLFCVEIGARFTFAGPLRDEELRNYIKKVVLDSRQAGSQAFFVAEMAKFERNRDQAGLSNLSERMARELPESDETFRLLVNINIMLGRPKKVEVFLKKALSLNPQSLWAANELGKIYLRTGRAAEGIELLEKLSQFNNLNGERFLELGNAYLNSGQSQKAETAFSQGDKIAPGRDGRFRDGMLKAAILDEDKSKIKAYMGTKTEYSRETISFLNTRAIMAMRAGKHHEGLALYGTAISGIKTDVIIAAKLRFNEGLGYMKAGKVEEAIHSFEQSVKLGGTKFQKAERSLKIAQSIVKQQEKAISPKAATSESAGVTPQPAQPQQQPQAMQEFEWESLD